MNNPKLINYVEPQWESFRWLFIFIAGIIGDLIVHILARNTWFGKSLTPYYDKVGTIPALLWGGIATTVGLLIAEILMQIVTSIYNEANSNENDN